MHLKHENLLLARWHLRRSVCEQPELGSWNSILEGEIQPTLWNCPVTETGIMGYVYPHTVIKRNKWINKFISEFYEIESYFSLAVKNHMNSSWIIDGNVHELHNFTQDTSQNMVVWKLLLIWIGAILLGVLIDMDLSVVQGDKYGSVCSILHVDNWLKQQCLLKRFLFFHCMILASWSKSVHMSVRLLLGLWFHSIDQPVCFWNSTVQFIITVSLEYTLMLGVVMPLERLLLFRIIFSILRFCLSIRSWELLYQGQ